MKTLLKKQIGKISIMALIVLSCMSCKKENIKHPTPNAGSYNISENAASGITDLMSQDEILQLFEPIIPGEYTFESGEIKVEDGQACLVLRTRGKATLTEFTIRCDLVNPENEGGLTLASGEYTLSSSDASSSPSTHPIPSLASKKKTYVGHVTLLK